MDKILTCRQCRSQFYFTEKDQAFYKKKGFNIPKLCPSCRKKPRTNTHVTRACSTCYFCNKYFNWSNKHQTWEWGCNRTNKLIINDAPCKNWSRKN